MPNYWLVPANIMALRNAFTAIALFDWKPVKINFYIVLMKKTLNLAAKNEVLSLLVAM